jgi:arylsulfatase A-like enzyme
LNASFQRNQDSPVNYAGEYTTDILASKALGFLDDAVSAGNPFFLAIAPVAPHSDVSYAGDGTFENSSYVFSAPISAERHKHLFKDVKVPRTENFNPKKVCNFRNLVDSYLFSILIFSPQASGVSWIRELPRQSEENVAYNDHFYRSRLRALQAVDELVDGVFARLESHGLLDSTYVIYSTDNGYHIGQHRLQPGKECSFEEDINIPLIIRGPGVAKNTTTEVVTTHTDLAATILNLIGENPRYDFDGTAIPVTPDEISAASEAWHEHVNVEYWGFAAGEGQFGSE